MGKKEIIVTDKAPAAIGPYSQAIRVGGFIFTSGQLPADPETGEIVSGGIKEQANRALTNLKAVLDAAGTDLDNVVKVNLYISDMDNFNTINEIYGRYFMNNPPARSCVEVARLPKDVLIEVEAIAIIKD